MFRNTQTSKNVASYKLAASYGSITPYNVAPFSPASVSGLARWYKADSLSLNNNDAVASWTDSSVNAAHAVQTSSAEKPTFKTNAKNGYPEVRFDGSDDFMRIPTGITFSTGQTLIIAGNWSGSENRPNGGIICGNGSGAVSDYSTGDNIMWNTGYNGTGPQSTGMNYQWRGLTGLNTTTIFTYSQFMIWTIGTLDAGGGNVTMFARSNGTQIQSSTKAGSTSCNPSVILALGSRTDQTRAGSTSGNTLKGSMSEVIIYNNYIGSTAIANVEAYLNAKYAVY
jgi:hypothetical protein